MENGVPGPDLAIFGEECDTCAGTNFRHEKLSAGMLAAPKKRAIPEKRISSLG
jgi:hypothetical protein